MKRALRRHHKQRMKARSVRVHGDFPGNIKLADHIKSCSCWACGNPRRHFDARTMQERRADLAIREDTP